jgi:sugar/nucleoside kinase (ribokinase family)
MSNKFEIINLNERVEKYLISRLNCKDSVALSKIIKAKLLIITRGIKGNDFIYQEKIYNFPLEKIVDEVDDSGAGDAFFSIIIKNWLNNNQEFNPKLFSIWVDDTKQLVEKVLNLVGSRTYIKEMYKVNKSDICNYK